MTTVGVELEFTGMTRQQAKNLLCNYFRVSANRVESYSHYGKASFKIKDRKGRIWKIAYDGSIKSSNGLESAQCELVSPILKKEEDIQEYLKVVNMLKRAGAQVNDSCGLHVHVGVQGFDGEHLRNIANLFYSKQKTFYKYFNIKTSRLKTYCQPLSYPNFIKKINDPKNKLMKILPKTGFKSAWYQGAKTSQEKYDTRYHALNFRSIKDHKTVEFRLFNGTLDTEKIYNYINLCKKIKDFCEQEDFVSHKDMASTETKTNEILTKDQFEEFLTNIGITDRNVIKGLTKVEKTPVSQTTERLNALSNRNLRRDVTPITNQIYL